MDPIKREVSQPLKNGVPVSTICQRLKKKAPEICALKFASSSPAVKVDANTDFSKMKISQLKTIMAEKNLQCNDCIEKDDFVNFLKASFAKEL